MDPNTSWELLPRFHLSFVTFFLLAQRRATNRPRLIDIAHTLAFASSMDDNSTVGCCSRPPAIKYEIQGDRESTCLLSPVALQSRHALSLDLPRNPAPGPRLSTRPDFRS